MLIRFTRPDGKPCYIDPNSVQEVTVAEGIGHGNAKTAIVGAAFTQYVIEDLSDVLHKLGIK
jgi:hypothetical protein